MKLIVLLCLCLAGAASAQQPIRPLPEVAEGTRVLWHRQDAAGLVARSPHLLIQLPGAEPSAPVQRQQAAELLRDYFAGAEEVETLVNDARELDNGWGFVELRRRFRTKGTQEVREQLLLLSYREMSGSWTLVELRVSR
jgi:hypothetical protein